MSSTSSKTVLVTGATSGIGRTTALHLAKRGYHVIGSGRREAELTKLADEAKGLGYRLDVVRMDVTSAESIATAKAEVDRLTGGKGVDVLVNNAGFGLVGPLTEISDSELRRAKDHLKGSVMLSLENTASRMSHLARQEIYFDRQFSLDETLEGVERVTTGDIQRVAVDLFADGALAATVLGAVIGLQLPKERLSLG